MLWKDISQIEEADHWYVNDHDCPDAERREKLIKIKSIDDDEITCPLPADLTGGNSTGVECFVAVASHAQISGKITMQLRRFKRTNSAFEQIMTDISKLQSALELWYSTLPPCLRMKPNEDIPPQNVHPDKILYIHLAYNASLIELHSILVHPWNSHSLQFDTQEQQAVSKQVLESADIVAEASRNIVHYLKFIRISPSSPKR
jgi:hypothetical protein